ncbi:MAG: proteasome assembly chaperone family protein [Halobaculum sp.]
MTGDISFDVEITESIRPGETLLVGMARPAVAGLTAVDYLVNNVETTQIGHVRARNLPNLTPFTDGRPRHPIRLYSTESSDLTVLVVEAFLPVVAAPALATALGEWATANRIEEITVLHGTQFPHDETQHVAFHVGTDDYRERRFPESLANEEADPATDSPDPDSLDPTAGEIPPLSGGFFDGIVAELVGDSMDGVLPPTGVLITPVHAPGPDLDAALTLLEAVESLYSVGVDETELERRSAEMREYYEGLAQRMGAYGSLSADESREDHMFM